MGCRSKRGRSTQACVCPPGTNDPPAQLLQAVTLTVLVADAVLEAGVVAAVLELLGACGRVTVRPAALAAAVI